jgi:hypothetical protein
VPIGRPSAIEIGRRVLLGAPLPDVLRGVVRHGVALTAIGVAIGIAGSLAVTQLLGSMLFDVKPSDPVTLIGVSCLLLMVAPGRLLLPGPARHARRSAAGASARVIVGTALPRNNHLRRL